jgi:predicted glutamine amidotransferase
MCHIGLISSEKPDVFPMDLENFFLGSQTTDNKDGWGIARYTTISTILELNLGVCKRNYPQTTVLPSLESLHKGETRIHLCKNPLDASSDHTCKTCFRLAFPSNLHLLHIRHMSFGNPDGANTHPFYRHWNGKDWSFVHHGTVEYVGWKTPHRTLGSFQPLGNTDSEKIFCTLLHALHEAKSGGKNLEDPIKMGEVLQTVTRKICRGKVPGSQVTGTMNYILTNGDFIFQFCNRENSMYRKEVPENKVIKIFTQPIQDDLPGTWEHVELGALNLYRNGTLVHRFEQVLNRDEIVSWDFEGSDYSAPLKTCSLSG